MIEINIVPYKHAYFSMLLEILESREYAAINAITHKSMPKIGYIALIGDKPVAAGFLRRLEPCYGQIDTLCSHAHFGNKIRHEALDKVLKALFAEGERLKLEGLMAVTNDAGVLGRATHTLGCHTVPGIIIAKKL